MLGTLGLAFIPSKFKIYAAGAVIIALLLLGGRSLLVRSIIAKMEAKQAAARIDALIKQKDLKDEFSKSDDSDLVDGLLGRR